MQARRSRRPSAATDSRHYIAARELSLGDLRMQAYQGVNLDLAAGLAHALCAEGGAGMPELLLTLAGRMRPSSGSCVVAGNDVASAQGMRALRRMSSLAFFEGVNDVQRVLRVRTIASAELGLAGKRSNRAATENFLVDWALSDVSDCIIEELTRPEYVRLGIALAMAHDPKLLLVSDIESGMTEHEAEEACDLLRRLARERTLTVVCGVIDYDLAARFDTATCITPGAVAQRGAWERKHLRKHMATTEVA